MKILGIESSCDETSAAVVENGRKIISNVVFSQNSLHRPFRGVVPEIASRAHLERINMVLDAALKQASLKGFPKNRSKKRSVDAIAVTVGPGLAGSLLGGRMAAEALGWAWGKPVIGVNHLEAHLLSPLLETPSLRPPFLGLIVSGGHTDLVLVKDFGKFEVIGRTRDDAAGESFDKVAKLLGLNYPGGPEIDERAKRGNPQSIPFPRPHLHGSWDFSFSGLKTAVFYYLRDRKFMKGDSRQTNDVAASFQAAVVEVLVSKAFLAAKKLNVEKIVLGGGVAANSELRARFLSEGRKKNVKIFLPSPSLCTDNAAMVALAGYFKWKKQSFSREMKGADRRLTIDPSLPIRGW